jgi:hypothetical protein
MSFLGFRLGPLGDWGSEPGVLRRILRGLEMAGYAKVRRK